MKKNRLCLGIFINLFFLFIPFFLLLAESNIQNITLQREGDYTRITITADSPFQFNHFIEEKKEGKPYRLVIDCLNSINSLPQSNFSQTPSGTISSIRTSQYQITPDKICRIVLDLKNPVIYKVEKGSGNKEAVFAFSTPEEPAYPLWSAVKNKATSKPTQTVKSELTEKTSQKGVAKAKENSPVEKSADKASKDQVAPAQKEKEIKLTQKAEATSSDKEKTPQKEKPELKKEVQKKPVEPPEKAKPEKTVVAEADTQKIQTPELPGSKVIAEVPKRKLLVYFSGKREDPFVPLTEKKNFALGTLPLPSIEELKLVGILEDNNGFKALLENELGYGYILQPGDQIRNGSVVSIDKMRIVFQIEEYGFTRNVALELFTPSQEER